MSSFDPFEKHTPDEALEEYLRLCQEVFLDMQRNDTWPWPESQNPADLVESTDT